MRIEKIAREHTGLFSDLANKLVYQQHELTSFLNQPFDSKAFAAQIKTKKESYSPENRRVLTHVLETQYSTTQASALQQENLVKLASENTFTVTTGHQLSLFTGPLYFVIKILHVVKLCAALKEEYPENEFVPLFWMASEDHDFEEINQVPIFNQNVQWETKQKGAVGRFQLENWNDFRNTLKDFFKNHPESEVMEIIEQYQGKNLSEATFHLVNALFKDYGVLALDADNAAEKTFLGLHARRNFAPKSPTRCGSYQCTIGKSTAFFSAHAREINLFLLSDQARERIQRKGEGYFVEGQGDFSQADLLHILDTTPERISPNVILRPLYQECILPNLCYVGGGGEMAYWLQLKGVFEAYQIPYPLIQVRNSLMIVDHNTSGKISAVNWMTPDLFKEVDVMKKQFVLTHTDDLNFTHLRLRKDDLVQAATELVYKVDPNLKGFLESEMTRLTKQIDHLEQKLLRAEKSKFEKSLKHMDQIKDKLFPKGGLQERSMNFFQLCADGEVFSHLSALHSVIEPFEKDFIVSYS